MKKPTSKAVAKAKPKPEPVKLTEAEKRVAEKVVEADRQRPIPPDMIFSKNKDGPQLSYAEEEFDACIVRMHSTTGLRNPKAVSFLLNQLMRLHVENIRTLDVSHLNQALAMLDELAPQGGAEAMLGAQMVAVHETAMNCLSRAAFTDQTLVGRELNLKFAAKLTRIFAQQMDTLERNRRGGQQKVTVEHVHVHDGGQAIVGTVQQGGG